MMGNETFPQRLAFGRFLSTAAEETETPVMDEDGFRVYHAKTARRLWAYLRRMTGQGALADDLLQDTYCRFLQSSFTGGGEPQTLAYLYRIATNLVLDHRRRARRENRQALEAPASPDPRGSTEARLEMERILQTMKPQERSLLWLAHVQGLDHAEIGAQLGMREQSVRVALFRAREKLAGILRRKGLAGDEVSR